MIHTGIVGYGFAGRSFHAYLISLVEGLQLAGVVTRDPARRQAAAERSVPLYASLDEMLENDALRLIVIATPHDTHADLAIRAMNAGRHVVVDKVMCMNTAEADAMIAASRKNSVLLSVFHNRRWDGDFLTVKKVLEDGLIGAPFQIETAVCRYRSSRGWRSSLEQSGGLLFDWGAHLVDQALQLVAARPVSVDCHTHKHLWDGDTEDHATCAIRFENGLLFTAEVSNLARIAKPRWRVLGTQGALVKEGLDPQEAAIIQGHIDTAEEPPEHRARIVTTLNGTLAEMSIESLRGSWKSYYQNISDVLHRGATPAVTAESMRPVMQVLDAARESAATGRSVPVKNE